MKSECVFRLRAAQIMVAFVCLFVPGHFGQAEDIRWGNLKANKILFLGNSLTLVPGPQPKIGWLGNWGMAASAEEKDFVHVLVNSVSRRTGSKPDIRVANIADFERGYDTYNVSAALKDQLAFQADIVIVQIGENMAPLASEESKALFKDRFSKLLTALKSSGQPNIFVCSVILGADAAKDGIMQQVCTSAGVVFVNMSRFSQNPLNYARSEDAYRTNHIINGHPGDQGMTAIAKALQTAIEKSGERRSNCAAPASGR